jgi:protein involved in polysaccharide export with SLBB domain
MSREKPLTVARAVRYQLTAAVIAGALVGLPGPGAWAASLSDGAAAPGTGASAVTTSPASTGALPGPLSVVKPDTDATYRLSPGDVVQVMVFGEPTLSGMFPLGPGGTVAMPALGQVALQGLTLAQAQKLLAARITKLVRYPAVTVTVNETQSVRKVYLSGELSRTGAVNLPFGATLTDALAVAGPGPYADLRRVRLTRAGSEPVEVDCSGLRGEGPLGTQYVLEYGDAVFAPRVREQVTVLGEVRAPGTLLLPVGQQVRVLDALRLAGGFDLAADRSTLSVLRPGADPVQVSLARLLQGGSTEENLLLHDGDTVVVQRAGTISVVGQVRAPTVFPAVTEVPILEALARVGGAAPGGDLRRAQVIRGGRTITVDLQAYLDAGTTPSEQALRSGDVLVVPPGVSDDVLIAGALLRTGSVNLRSLDRRDLLRAITVAGYGPGSDLTRVTVYRDNTALVRNLKATLDEGDFTQNLELEAGDVVMVPQAEVESALITGALGRQGVVAMTRPGDHDLLRLVMSAGTGVLSDLSRVTVHRKGETLVRNLRAALDEGKLDQNLMVEDGDVITVPEVSQTVVVSGPLARSGLVRLLTDEQKDLAKLVNLAGPYPIADLSRVTVTRGNLQTVVNVKAWQDGSDKSQTLQLQDGDVVKVPVVEDRILLTGALYRAGVIRLVEGVERDLATLVLTATPAPTADLERVTVFRGDQKIVVNLRAMADSGDRTQALQVQAGDIVSVPPRTVHSVLVTGAVGRAGLVDLVDDSRRDLARLVTLAGPLPSADLTKVAVRRGGLTTTRDIKAYLETGLGANTLALENGDVVVVPSEGVMVTVMGAVSRAGSLQVGDEKQRDLVRLLAMAGPLETADLSKVTVFRGGEALVRNVQRFYDQGDASQTLQLEDGDIVKVPAYSGTVLLAGAAARLGEAGLGPQELRDLARYVQAATPAPWADLSRVAVHRDGQVLVRDVRAYLQDGDASQTLDLQDGDVVVIPVGPGTATVTGAVTKAGPVVVTEPQQRDLAEILLTAGPLPAADLRNVIVYHGETQTTYDMSGLRRPVALPATAEIVSGDRVFVPGLDTAGVVISGAVSRMGMLELVTPEQRELAQAVLSVSPLPSADLEHVTVFRNGESLLRNVKGYLDRGDDSQKLELQDGDRVVVPETTGGGVVVYGQVSRQGQVPLGVGQQRDLLGAVTVAGALVATADMTRVTVYRKGDRLVRDLQRLQDEGDLSQNLMLEPGDMVVVPEAVETVVFAGQVNRPGPTNVHNVRNATLSNLLPAAGPLNTADLSQVIIYRDGERLVRDYRALIEKGDQSQDERLLPGDMVYVPTDEAHEVMVVGAVTRPGPVNVAREADRDLLRLLTSVTPTAEADLQRVSIYRGDQEPIFRDVQALMDEGDLSQSIKLEPGDVVMVPRQGEVYVLGGVLRQGAYMARPGWNVMDALAAAGYLSPNARKSIVLVRRKPDGGYERINIDLAKISSGQPPEPTLVKAGDIVFVPTKGTGFKFDWSTLRTALLVIGTAISLFN